MEKISNSHPKEIHSYKLRTKNYKLNKSLLIWAICGYGKTLFLQNEPNFKTSQNNVSAFSTTVYCMLSSVFWTSKQTQTKPIKPNFPYM